MPAFHRAVLSAHQVRCEYAILLIEFWDAMWKPALDKFDFGTTLEPLPVAASGEWWSEQLDTNAVWSHKWFNRFYKFSTSASVFGAGVSADGDSARLAIGYHGADENARTNELELGEKWPKGDIEDGVAYTSKMLAPIGDGEIDLTPLRKAADDALGAIKKTYLSDR